MSQSYRTIDTASELTLEMMTHGDKGTLTSPTASSKVSLIALATFASLVCTAVLILPRFAHAATEGTAICKISELKRTEETRQNSAYLGVRLESCEVPADAPAPGGLSSDGKGFVWAPITLETALQGIQARSERAAFSMTGAYFGRLLELNGNLVGELNPKGARSFFSSLMGEEGSLVWHSVLHTLKLTGQSEKVSLESEEGNLFEITVRLFPAHQSRHGWVDSYVSVRVHGLADAALGNVITLSKKDSAVVREKFKFGILTEFVTLKERIRFEDNGQRVQIKRILKER